MKKTSIMLGQDQYADRFSLAIAHGDLVFVSGQGPIDARGEVRRGSIEQEIELTLENLRDVLAGAGCTMDDCLKVTVYLKDLADYGRFNAVYRRFFRAPLPARSVVGADLNFGIRVEIEAIAARGAAGD